MIWNEWFAKKTFRGAILASRNVFFQQTALCLFKRERKTDPLIEEPICGSLFYLFKRAFRTKLHTFSTRNTFCAVHSRQGETIVLCDSALGTDSDGRASVILRAFMRIYCNFHIQSLQLFLAVLFLDRLYQNGDARILYPVNNVHPLLFWGEDPGNF